MSATKLREVSPSKASLYGVDRANDIQTSYSTSNKTMRPSVSANCLWDQSRKQRPAAKLREG